MIDFSRTDFITGLRHLADFLDTNPAVPAPSSSLNVYCFLPNAEDAAMAAAVDRIAAYLGTTVDPDDVRHGHHTTAISFGPVRYEVAALLSTARIRQKALHDHFTTPDA
ncbi:hypothetical protein [Acrocarpospora catenulata]|uniref:hypothetical protein n=1 Tax=Acrocarpospora catenulata TaxID=2836182 RepID=UPI001BDAA16B|nr:hypothetical protein [Acrocarpospora catenulata]